jgi:phospholipid/cholesterol/gamma-HCH transport system ATP-binding protein
MYDIYLKNITLIKNERKILDNISVHIPKGKTTIIIGPSGCGKSTLLKVAAAIIPIDYGTILVDDQNLRKMTPQVLLEFRKKSSFVFQDAALWANKSVYQNMSLPLKLHFPKMDAKIHDEKIREMLKMVGYTDSVHLRPAALSNGERKIVSLARALITSPELIYMDNPLVLVDPSVAKKMKKLIINLHKTESTIVGNFSSSDLVNKMADYLIIMKDGKLVESGEKESVLESHNPITKGIIDSLLKHDHN